MKQKTIRFYENVPEDVRALEKLSKYREYGFRSSQEMIIEAINHYDSGNISDSPRVNGQEMEDLANRLIDKLKEKKLFIVQGNTYEGEQIDENHSNINDNDNMFQKALTFMESL